MQYLKAAMLALTALLLLAGSTLAQEDTLLVPVRRPMPTASIEATPSAVRAGEEVTLTVSSENGQVGLITPIGVSMLNGKLVDTPQQTTNYIFSVDGEGGTVHSSVLVEVLPAPPPEASIEARPSTIKAGETATLTVTGKHIVEGIIEIEGGFTELIRVDTLGGSAEWKVKPERTTTYIYKAIAASGDTLDRSATVVVLQPPSAKITPPDTIIRRGDTVELTLESHHADHRVLAPPDTNVSGPVAHITVAPEHTTTYHFAVHGPGGSAHSVATVVVEQPSGSRWHLGVGVGLVSSFVDGMSFFVPAAMLVGDKDQRWYVTLSGGYWPLSAAEGELAELGDRAETIASLAVSVYPASPTGRWGLALGVLGAWNTVREFDTFLERAYGLTGGVRVRTTERPYFVVGLDLQVSNLSEFGRPGSRWRVGVAPSINFTYVFR